MAAAAAAAAAILTAICRAKNLFVRE